MLARAEAACGAALVAGRAGCCAPPATASQWRSCSTLSRVTTASSPLSSPPRRGRRRSPACRRRRCGCSSPSRSRRCCGRATPPRTAARRCSAGALLPRPPRRHAAPLRARRRRRALPPSARAVLRRRAPVAPPPLATADGGRVRLPTDRGLPSQRLRRAAADDGAGAAEAEAGAVYNRRALREPPRRARRGRLGGAGLDARVAPLDPCEAARPGPPRTLGRLRAAAAARRARGGGSTARRPRRHPRPLRRHPGGLPDQLEAQLLCRLPHWARDASALAGGADLLDTLMLQSELHLARVARAAPPARERAFALAAEGKEAVTAPPPPQPLFPRWPCLPASPPLLFALLQPSAPPVALDAAADGSVVACACADGSARVFDLATGGADALIVAPPAEAGRFHEQAALGVALSPDASFLVVHTAAWHVSIYALPSAATPSLLSATRLTDLAPGGDGAPSLPPLAPLPLVVGDGLLLCSGGAGGAQLRVGGSCRPPPPPSRRASATPSSCARSPPTAAPSESIALAADGARAATAGADGLLVLWARRQGSGAWVKEAEADADDVAAVNSVALLHAGRPLAATGGDDAVVRVWHVEAGKGGDGGGGLCRARSRCAATRRRCARCARVAPARSASRRRHRAAVGRPHAARPSRACPCTPPSPPPASRRRPARRARRVRGAPAHRRPARGRARAVPHRRRRARRLAHRRRRPPRLPRPRRRRRRRRRPLGHAARDGGRDRRGGRQRAHGGGRMAAPVGPRRRGADGGGRDARAGEEVTALALDESLGRRAVGGGRRLGLRVGGAAAQHQPPAARAAAVDGGAGARARAQRGRPRPRPRRQRSLRQWAWAGGAQTLAAAPAPLILPDNAAALGAAALAGELVLGSAIDAADVYVWKRSRLGACELLHRMPATAAAAARRSRRSARARARRSARRPPAAPSTCGGCATARRARRSTAAAAGRSARSPSAAAPSSPAPTPASSRISLHAEAAEMEAAAAAAAETAAAEEEEAAAAGRALLVPAEEAPRAEGDAAAVGGGGGRRPRRGGGGGGAPGAVRAAAARDGGGDVGGDAEGEQDGGAAAAERDGAVAGGDGGDVGLRRGDARHLARRHALGLRLGGAPAAPLDAAALGDAWGADDWDDFGLERRS